MSTPKSAPSPKRKGKASPLDAHVALLGTMPDPELAKLAGTTHKAVAQYRNRRKIPAFSAAPVAAESAAPVYEAAAPAPTAPAPAPAKPKTQKAKPPVKAAAKSGGQVKAPAKPAAQVKALVKAPVKAAAATTKPPASKAKAPAAAAKLKGKPTPSAKGKRRTASAILDARRDIVGVLDDRAAAKQAGVSHETVRKYRIEHNIPSAASRTHAASAPASKAAPAAKAPKAPKAGTSKPVPVAAKLAAVVAPTAPVNKLGGANSVCWRGTVAGGEPVYVVANGLGAAAARLEAALGAAVTSVERVGPAVG